MGCSAPVQRSRHSTPGFGMIWTIGVPSVWKSLEVRVTKSEILRDDIFGKCSERVRNEQGGVLRVLEARRKEYMRIAHSGDVVV